ncbi:hypothetical protein H632_c2202p0 [Helicosporidium sp. ATCC 50920]|nr:hypothetical protein H632_c2202p0 [Helicosporidium sp. ATCC 50920]|eukprot:KDD73412.1 hypothetical protein H632_c2202p0 [Helicosporidium sp. ATCC 50920]
MAGRAAYPYGSHAHPASAVARREEEEDEEEGTEGSDEEAAALQRIRNRGSARRTPNKRDSVDRGSRQAKRPREEEEEPVEEADDWVQCDRCNKWRLLRKDVFQRTVRENEPWYCELNYGR